MYSNEILSPKSLADALAIKDQYGKDIFPLAGGTDVLVMVRNKLGIWGNSPPLLNLNSIPDIDFIRETKNTIEIGPLVTHTQLLESSLIDKYIPALKKAVSIIGAPQIRNLGTIIGNMCRASPAADTLTTLYARDTQVQIQTVDTLDLIPIEEFITGPGSIDIPKNGLVTKIVIPKLEGYKGDYISLRQRYALSIVVVSIAVEALLSKDGSKLEDIRISLGAVAPTIVRATKTESFLRSQNFTIESITQAENLITEECTPITDIRSNEKYRKAMTGVLLGRFLRGLK
ncbi:MAG: FAD binding domain-containing protein [Candidatus Hodarchaeales archaeon]|jgi:xanthine dehydrogenase FAD-binding subunit